MKSLKDYIFKNKSIISKALEIDSQVWDSSEEIVNENVRKQIKDLPFEESKTYMIVYDGEINITKAILEKAIDTNSNVLFMIDDYYLATNTVLIGIANKLLEEKKSDCFFKLYNKISEDRLFENSKEVDLTLYIGPSENFKYMKDNIKGNLINIEN